MTPVGGSTPVSVIDKVRRLVMMAGSSLRSLPRIFEIFQSDTDPHAHVPSASGARWWLLRIGLYALREPLDRWAQFIAKLGQTKSRLQQTPDAFLMSPGLRPKARYMNLASLLRWSRRILELLARGTAGGSVTERTRARYGWMEHYRAVLTEWARWEDTVRSSVEFIRVHGFFQHCDVELAVHLCARPTAMRHACVEAELITFARHESASARPGERLVGSSEVEESVFGKLKTLEGDQCSSGFTRYVLSLGAVVGDWTTIRLKEALEKKGFLENASRGTISRVLSWTFISLGCRLLDTSSSRPEGMTNRTDSGQSEDCRPFCLALLPMGFTQPARSPEPLVRSYRTVSPLPRRSLLEANSEAQL